MTDDLNERAGEYVLGTLSVADAAAFDTALKTDPALQSAVYAWQDRLLALSARAAPDAPSPVLWQRIAVAVEALVRPVATIALPWWRRAAPWQVIGGLSLASCVGMALLLATGQRPTAPPAGGHYLAVLQSPGGEHVNGWLVDLRADGRLRLMPVAAGGAVPEGRSLQFWTKPQGAAGPTSLGLVRAGQTVELPSSALPAVGAAQLFEITLEPAEGSPIGKPTGPILYVGRTVQLQG